MKKIFLTIIALIVLGTGCKEGSDYADPASSSGLTIEAVFNNAQNSERFLMDIYRRIIPVLMRTDNAGSRWRNNHMLEAATENGSYNTVGNFHNYNVGAITPGTTNLFSYNDWNEYYGAIRECYLFLENASKIPDDSAISYTAATRKVRIAEVKWLLAFFYAELAKEFGGVPLVTKVITVDETIDAPRSTYDQTIAHIVTLCNEAAADLPAAAQLSSADLGRATKGAALALKARMLLYAASPLWNDSSNPVDAPSQGKYDVAKWQKAAEAAKDVIALNSYALHPDISTLFNSRTNSEIIFARMQEPMSYFSATAVPYKLYVGTGAYNIGGNHQVTYNMIKEYEVLRGGVAYSVDDPASLHNFQDPYKNRDPRFYRDNIYNGAKLILNANLRTAEFGDVASGVNKTPAHNMIVSQYNTYVFNVKFSDLTLNVTWDARSPGAGTRTNQNYPYLRYAEVLLNYAEAMNEVYGPDADGLGIGKTARQALNEVRTRAQYPVNTPTSKVEYLGYTGGMPPLPTGLSKATFSDRLRHERRVEFAFEEHWFWDTRRWKRTPETNIRAEIPVWTSPTVVQYQIKTIDTRYWDPKLFRMPIPDAEILANRKLVQNPGW